MKQAGLTTPLRALQIFMNCLLIYSIFTFNSIVGLANLFREQEPSDDILQTDIIEGNKRKWAQLLPQTAFLPSSGLPR